MAETGESRASRRRLSRVHARSGDGDDGDPLEAKGRASIDLEPADACGNPYALSQEREAQDRAQHFAAERRPARPIVVVAHPEDAAEVQEMHEAPRLEAFGHVTRVAEKSFPMPERSDEHIPLPHRRHAAARELELVVAGLVVQDLDGDDRPLLRGDLVGEADVGRKAAAQRHGGDLVGEDTFHRMHIY
jgi:hypothetical protein